MPRFPNAVATAVFSATIAATGLAAAQEMTRIKAGTLSCDISAGIGLIIASKKELTCLYTPSTGVPQEVYVGAIN